MKKRYLSYSWFADRVLLAHPRWVLFFFFMFLGVCGYYARDFRIEASSDTLVMKGDESFRYFQKIWERYKGKDFVVIAYIPKSEDLFSKDTLAHISLLKKELQQIKGVDSVTTLLDVPLFQSPPVELKELLSGIHTITSPETDKRLARIEFTTSPLYKDLLVSPDGTTTAIQVVLTPDEKYESLWRKRVEMEDRIASGQLSKKDLITYNSIVKQIRSLRASLDERRHETIGHIRDVMKEHKSEADLFLGGVSVIADDMMAYIRNDLAVFGTGVVIFLVVVLGSIFRRIAWVVLPMGCCFFSVLATIGILGFFQWPVTVISSNFVSLQLIITMAIAIHLVVRYRELSVHHPGESHRSLILQTVESMKTPILYAAMTTIAGFGSLLWSRILPVITFGWMMIAGIVVSLVVSFIFFPSALVLMKKPVPPETKGGGASITKAGIYLVRHHGKSILAVSLLLLLFAVLGVKRLSVENAFINYFRESTEIYQGLSVIDRKLGGTTPLDVIVSLDETEDTQAAAQQDSGTGDDEFDMFSEFEKESDSSKYWFTPYRLSRIEAIHDYLESDPFVGKVLSLATLKKIAEQINKKPLDSFDLSLLFNEFPPKYRDMLIKPYVSVKNNEARISARIRDSAPGLRRGKLLKKIKTDIVNKLGFKPDKVKLTNLLVLYNEILQRLFDSQIRTLGIVLLALGVMFLILFRSFLVSVIALFPNLLSVAVVLGFMGWAGIPLDIMTITIASISVSIAVDDTIHYIHRFRREVAKDGDYIAAMERSHGSIGFAMYYTSVTIIIGFSILSASNFIPTILFGLLTSLAMAIAIVAALTLLPELLILLKPFKNNTPA